MRLMLYQLCFCKPHFQGPYVWLGSFSCYFVVICCGIHTTCHIHLSGKQAYNFLRSRGRNLQNSFSLLISRLTRTVQSWCDWHRQSRRSRCCSSLCSGQLPLPVFLFIVRWAKWRCGRAWRSFLARSQSLCRICKNRAEKADNCRLKMRFKPWRSGIWCK